MKQKIIASQIPIVIDDCDSLSMMVNNLVRIFTPAYQVPADKSKIAFSKFRDHHSVYEWTKALAALHQTDKVDMLFVDYHSDDGPLNELHCGNWISYLRRDNLLNNTWHLRPTWTAINLNKPLPKWVGNIREFNIQPTRPLVVTLDYDYFIFMRKDMYGNVGHHRRKVDIIPDLVIKNEVNMVFNRLLASGVRPIGINITVSPEYIDDNRAAMLERNLITSIRYFNRQINRVSQDN